MTKSLANGTAKAIKQLYIVAEQVKDQRNTLVAPLIAEASDKLYEALRLGGWDLITGFKVKRKPL